MKNTVAKLVQEGLTEEQAINKLVESGEVTEASTIERLRSLLNLSSGNFLENASVFPVNPEINESLQLMRDAFEKANLTKIERKLLEAHMNGENNYRRIMSETVINRNTGKLWTKQRLSQLFLRACDKVRETYQNQILPKAA